VNDKSAYELRYFVVRLSDTVTGIRDLSINKPLLPSFLFMGAVGRTKEVNSTTHTQHVQMLIA
jgi:hypothetical protein